MIKSHILLNISCILQAASKIYLDGLHNQSNCFIIMINFYLNEQPLLRSYSSYYPYLSQKCRSKIWFDNRPVYN